MTTNRDLQIARIKTRLKQIIAELRGAENPFYAFTAQTCREALEVLEGRAPRRAVVRRKR